MAKKRFTDNMDNLFSGEPKAEGSLTLFPQEQEPSEGAADQPRKSGKGFAASLDAFLAEAFEQSEQERGTAELSPNPSPVRNKTPEHRARGRRAASGLDLLIRQTSDETQFVPQQHDTRRVTLIFNKEHLEQLKTIARDRQVYLKDLIGEIVEHYLGDS